MEFNVAELLKGSVGATRRFTVAELVKLPDLEGGCWVNGGVLLLRTDKGVLAQCALETAAECQCSRCLALYRQPLRLTIEEEFLPVVDLGGAPAPTLDDEAFTLDEHHVLRLEEALRQYLLISLPMQPLCQEGCLGMCPRCGADRNRQTCRCSDPSADSPWSPLLQLRERKVSRN